ncbi:MAG TPA: M20/M25/M40 family metallo-hydrolase [Gaiellaceae bacterium]|nr:M20/M25/M40 family metallo-hydrolase [Gaiellaceae bacterium]
MQTTWASDVLPVFLELAAIPSPSGAEGAVARYVRDYLRRLGLEAEEDAGGNILARLPATEDGGTPIFLCAHMDTVPPTGAIEPFVDAGVVRNAAGTILGADNKASVAVLLESARLLLGEGRPHAGIELLFTTREETGLEGAKEFDHARLRARLGFVYDYSGPVGDVVVAAPSGCTLDAVFIGRPAHSGINPEDGRSAVLAAARAVADLRLGRIDDETTANVGRIEGGSARNVVPARCTLAAEARSRDERKLADLVQEMLDCFAFAAAVAECEVEATVEEKYAGYRLPADDPALALAKLALARAGFAPCEVEVGGGADANVFNAAGIPCVNMANGMSKVHTAEEEIAVADLEGMVRVTLALADAARAADA